MPDYYVRIVFDGLNCIEDFWAVDENIAYQGIMPSTLGTHDVDPGKDMLTTLQDRFVGSQFTRLSLGPGEYFPRMARPSSTRLECSPGHNPDESATARNIRTTSTGQLHALIQDLQQICRVVQPIGRNFDAYGHEIRNIIIIACTEVEAHWKNILAANSHTSRDRHDYVKLSPAMKLGEYQVTLPWYPWLDPIAPFENWVPTARGVRQHLPWYDAYNDIKHDRENHFAEAKLRYAFDAVAACFVMLCAQYGWDFAKSGSAAEDIFFRLIEVPTWAPSEIYIPPHGGPSKARAYQF